MDEYPDVSVPIPYPDSQSSSLKPDALPDHAGEDVQSPRLRDQLQKLDLKDPADGDSEGRRQDLRGKERSGLNHNGYGSGSDSAGNDGGSARNDEDTRPLYPLRLDAEDCAYYMKTGNCKFGSNCKFNHPVRRRCQGSQDGVKERDEHSERPSQIECKYYLRSGGCKYGKACRYNHGKAKTLAAPVLELNFVGLPIRQGEKECPYYMRTGSCKFGANCKFDHPDPTTSGKGDTASVYGNGVASGSVLSQATSQATVASWSSSVPLNGTTHCVPVIFPPTQGAPSQAPEWNGYQVPSVYTLQRNVPPTNLYFVNNPLPESSAYTRYQPQIVLDEFPERPGQPECGYYLKTGDCKYRSRCKYHHPKNRIPKPAPCALSDKGLPLRPGQKICMNFSRYGICKFGPTCRYDHSIQQPNSSSQLQPDLSQVFNGSQAAADATVNADGNESDGWN